MKTCLICPAGRPAVAALAQNVPLSNLSVLGKSLLEYWLENQAAIGAKHVLVLAVDRPELVRQLAGVGTRWGLNVEVIAETRELSPAFAREKYSAAKGDWLPKPHDVVSMTHFPGQPQNPLFTGYSSFFSALLAWLPRAATINRIGVRELQPGIWIAMRARIADSARLQAPCWIGEGARIGPRSIIGPGAILENHVLVESDCDISNSMICTETMVGKFAELKESLACGGIMVDWRTGSLVKVPDPFLMC